MVNHLFSYHRITCRTLQFFLNCTSLLPTKSLPAVQRFKPLEPIFDIRILIEDFPRPSLLSCCSVWDMEQIRQC